MSDTETLIKQACHEVGVNKFGDNPPNVMQMDGEYAVAFFNLRGEVAESIVKDGSAYMDVHLAIRKAWRGKDKAGQ